MARAQEQAAFLIEERGLTEAAEAEGRRILENAEDEAAQIRSGADEYAASVLGGLEADVARTLRSIERGIAMLDERRAAYAGVEPEADADAVGYAPDALEAEDERVETGAPAIGRR